MKLWASAAHTLISDQMVLLIPSTMVSFCHYIFLNVVLLYTNRFDKQECNDFFIYVLFINKCVFIKNSRWWARIPPRGCPYSSSWCISDIITQSFFFYRIFNLLCRIRNQINDMKKKKIKIIPHVVSIYCPQEFIADVSCQ